MDHANIRMTQPRCSACFLCEAAQAIGIFADKRWKNFQCHSTAEDRVGGEIDFTHPTFADEIDDLVMLYTLAGGEFLFGAGE